MAARSSSVLGSERLIAFVATTDAARARAFYGGTLGLRLVSEDGFALVFRVKGTMLRVQIVPKVAPAPYTSLGWQVADIVAIARTLKRAGVLLERFPGMPQDALGIWKSPSGARVGWFRDPDGNILSLTQL